MEHRCGNRYTTKIQARVKFLDGLAYDAQVADISLSGARLLTRRNLPSAPVTVTLRPPRREEIELLAHIVRHRPNMIAVEWDELAPSAVLQAVLDNAPINRGHGSYIAMSKAEADR